jgi:hypothetical protein
VKQIPDDPQIRSAEKTGYPTWYDYEIMEGEDDFDGDGEVYYGNETEGF